MSVTNGTRWPLRWSRHTPPPTPRFARRNDPSGSIAIPLGRMSCVLVASHVTCDPSASSFVTPPRQSGTQTSPSGFARTHSGRCRSLPTGSSSETDTGPTSGVSFTGAHGNTGIHITDTVGGVRVVRGL